MVAIPLGASHYARALGGTPRILVINMFVEKDPANLVDGLVRLQRPGLAPFASAGSGPVRAVFRQSGTFNGDYLVVSGGTLYRVDATGVAAVLGSIAGSGRVSIAANATRALIATGSTCYSTNGSTVTTVAMPDSKPVSSVAQINGYFILTVADSQEFFWIAPGGTDPEALDFASAENAPDNIVLAQRIYDELWFFGEGSIEVWQPTGDADAPFQRIAGRLYEKGCGNKDTVAATDNTLMWVGDDQVVYRGDVQPVRISDHGIEEAIRINGSEDLRAWSFARDGHTFYCLSVGDSATYVFDVESATWYAWKSYGREVWRAHIGVQSGSAIVAGDDVSGQLWSLDSSRSNDNGDPLVREVLGGVPWAGSKPLICSSVSLFVATGCAPLTGDASDPIVEMNWSDDGVTFPGAWRQMSLGRQGQYGIEVVERQLGAIFAPGRLFRFRMSDDTIFRVSYARMNEA